VRRGARKWIFRVEQERWEKGAASAVSANHIKLVRIPKHALRLSRDRIDVLADLAHLWLRGQRSHADSLHGRIADLHTFQSPNERLHERLDDAFRNECAANRGALLPRLHRPFL